MPSIQNCQLTICVKGNLGKFLIQGVHCYNILKLGFALHKPKFYLAKSGNSLGCGKCDSPKNKQYPKIINYCFEVRKFTSIVNLFNEGDARSKDVQRRRQKTRWFSTNSNRLRFLNLGNLGNHVNFWKIQSKQKVISFLILFLFCFYLFFKERRGKRKVDLHTDLMSYVQYKCL